MADDAGLPGMNRSILLYNFHKKFIICLQEKDVI